MPFPVPRATRSLLALPLVLLTACGTPEGNRPPAPVPTGWRHCSHGRLEFDCPPEWRITTRPLDDDSLDLVLTTAEGDGERCVLALHFGPEFRFPTMACMKPFAKRAYDTRIGGARARRIDPSELPGTSEGVLELGGPGLLHRAHFRYAHLDAPARQAAEQVLASLRNGVPGR